MRTRSLAAASLSCMLLFGASAAVSAQDEPKQLLAQALQATSTATSFHFLVTADGTLNFGEMLGDTPFPITGTKAEGDVSVTTQSAQLTFDIPLGAVSLTGGVIYPNDGSLYVKLALPNASSADLWHKIAMDSLPMGVGASPSPGAPDIAAKIEEALTASGATLTDEGDTPCGAGTCTKLHLELPASAINGRLGALMPGESAAPSPVASAAAAAPIPVDILVDNATSRIDSLTTHVVGVTEGTDVTVTIALSAYDVPVTVTAPPADQVTDESLFGS